MSHTIFLFFFKFYLEKTGPVSRPPELCEHVEFCPQKTQPRVMAKERGSENLPGKAVAAGGGRGQPGCMWPAGARTVLKPVHRGPSGLTHPTPKMRRRRSEALTNAPAAPLMKKPKAAPLHRISG